MNKIILQKLLFEFLFFFAWIELTTTAKKSWYFSLVVFCFFFTLQKKEWWLSFLFSPLFSFAIIIIISPNSIMSQKKIIHALFILWVGNNKKKTISTSRCSNVESLPFPTIVFHVCSTSETTKKVLRFRLIVPVC